MEISMSIYVDHKNVFPSISVEYGLVPYQKIWLHDTHHSPLASYRYTKWILVCMLHTEIPSSPPHPPHHGPPGRQKSRTVGPVRFFAGFYGFATKSSSAIFFVKIWPMFFE